MLGGPRLPESNMETQKGPHKDYSPFLKGGYMGFNVSLGESSGWEAVAFRGS